MTKQILNPTTFVADSQQEAGALVRGTVEITLQGKTKRVRCYQSGDRITAFDVGVKYKTGTKVWHGSVTHWIEKGTENVDGGFDNRASRSRIATIVGFYSDVAEAHTSKRNGTR